MDINDFDVVLDASDENFREDLMDALGVKPGDSINIVTPQFERTDGRVVTYRPDTPEEFEALKKMTPDNLKKVGCQIWDEENGKRTWLYPAEWYDSIPNGTEIVDIFGNVELFERGETDDDKRYGALSFGFVQEMH